MPEDIHGILFEFERYKLLRKNTMTEGNINMTDEGAFLMFFLNPTQKGQKKIYNFVTIRMVHILKNKNLQLI